MDRLLLAGGSRDPNLGWLRAAAEKLGIDCQSVLVDPDTVPAFVWDVGTGEASVDGRKIECSAGFLRYDVFSGMTNGGAAAVHASAWFAALSAYVVAADLFAFNRDIDAASGSKPEMLRLADRSGLKVPATMVTNAREPLRSFAAGESIAKPVGGGSYVMGLDEALQASTWQQGASPSPAIVQPRLVYPERRIYRAGCSYFAFDIGSKTIDSRLDPQCVIRPVQLEDIPDPVLAGVRTLTDRIRCDFCAIDMKTDPATGELVFLELNNGPMFMGYDQTCGGTMAEAMVRYLMAGGGA